MTHSCYFCRNHCNGIACIPCCDNVKRKDLIELITAKFWNVKKVSFNNHNDIFILVRVKGRFYIDEYLIESLKRFGYKFDCVDRPSNSSIIYVVFRKVKK